MEQIAKHIYSVYKEKSFTGAAKKLFISQPALSTAISRFEKENNIRIFDRSTVPLTLTPEGRIYIDMIEEMIESENNMHRRLRELNNSEHLSLSIGGKIYSSYFLMSSICSSFYKKFPEVHVSIHIGNAGRANFILEKLINDEIDLLFSYVNDTDFISTPIYTENFIIAMHKDMKGADGLKSKALTRNQVITGQYDKNKEIDDLLVFKDIPFITFNKLSSINNAMEKILVHFKTTPYNIFTARHSEMHYNLMCAGIGAILTTDTVIAKTEHDSENILYFKPKRDDACRTIYLLRKQHTDNNPVVRDFMEVARRVCKPENILKTNINY